MSASVIQKKAWLKLSLAGLKAEHRRSFLKQCGDPAIFFDAADKTWRSFILRSWGDVDGQVILRKLDAVSDEEIAKTLKWAEEVGNHILLNTYAIDNDDESVGYGNITYPKKLANISDAPMVLYAKGDLDWLLCPSVAIVGSRSASVYGLMLAEDFAEDLAKAGLVVTSGLALGVDAAAHRGALKINGATIAVLGTGPNIIYPSKNRSLAKQIAERGLIVSEFPLDAQPRPYHFPRRNRIIAALSLGTLVVEASEKSGALITAHIAAELGRDVFAVPGSVHSPMSRGPHRLLREGAKLVETTQDILEELYGQLTSYVREQTQTNGTLAQLADIGENEKNAGVVNVTSESGSELKLGLPLEKTLKPTTKTPPLKVLKKPISTKANKKELGKKPTTLTSEVLVGGDLLKSIPYSPVLLDYIVEKSGLPLSEVHGMLLDLEMAGWVESMAGGRFQRIK